MAARPRRTLAGSISAWVPRHSIIGRVLFPLLEERRSLPAVLTWIGLIVVLAFIFIALLAPVIAPWDPYAFVDERDVSPWTNAPILANSTYFSFAPSNWTDMTFGQAIDGRSASSAGVNDSVIVSDFLVRVLRDSVTDVSYIVLLNGAGTSPGQYLGVEYSTDQGVSWSARTDIRTVDQFVPVDLTSQRAWNLASVSPGTFQLRLTHLADGNTTGSLALDFTALNVVWLSYWHFMGTDPVGRDVFSRILFGTSTSLEIMAIGVFVALLVGFPIGLFSGYTGGRIDKVLVLVMDSLYAFPGLLLAGLIAVLVGKGVVIIWRYIASNVLVAIPVIFSLSAADAVLTAAGLSYLGLGVEAPIADWGLDLSAASSRISVGIWWSSFFPGLIIVLLTIGLSFLGEGLNDIINPVLRKERS